MSQSHKAIRPDDMRHLSVEVRKQRTRDRVETIKRLHTMPTYNIMNALRLNGLYSHRTSDQQIIKSVLRVLKKQGLV